MGTRPSPVIQAQNPILYNEEGEWGWDWANLQTHKNLFDYLPNTDLQTKWRKEGTQQGHFLVPEIEMASPHTREKYHFDRPWRFYATEQELKVEGKFEHSFKDILFVMVDGEEPEDDMHLFFSMAIDGDPKIYMSGGEGAGKDFAWYDGGKSMDRTGEDMHGRQAYTAIPIGYDNLQLLTNGGIDGEFKVHTEDDKSGSFRFRSALQFLRVVETSGGGFATVPITSSFACNADIIVREKLDITKEEPLTMCGFGAKKVIFE